MDVRNESERVTSLQRASITAIEKKIDGRTTSKAERLMRTVNMRLNMSTWSERPGKYRDPPSRLNVSQNRRN